MQMRTSLLVIGLLVIASSIISAASDSLSSHVYRVDPSEPAQQARLYAKYVDTVPATVAPVLKALADDDDLNILLDNEKPLAGSPAYWNRKWNKEEPPYYPEWQQVAGEDDGEYAARMKAIDEKHFFLSMLWANAETVADAPKTAFERIRTALGSYGEGCEIGERRAELIRIAAKYEIDDITFDRSHLRLTITGTDGALYDLFIAYKEWYHSPYQLVSMLLYHDEWSERKLYERYDRLSWASCWAYQYRNKSGEKVLDDDHCWVLVARDRRALTGDANAAELHRILTPGMGDTVLREQLFGPNDALPVDRSVWENGAWARAERAGLINAVGLWSIKPATVAVMPTEPPTLQICHEQWPGLGAKHGTYHVHGATQEGTASNALVGLVEGHKKLLQGPKGK